MTTITLNKKNARDRLIKFLNKRGIDARQMVNPVSDALYLKKKFNKKNFPVSYEISRNSVHLPSSITLNKKKIYFIFDEINFFSLKKKYEKYLYIWDCTQAKVLFRIIASQKQYIFKYFVSDKMSKKFFLIKKIISLNQFMKIKENTNIFIAIGENSKEEKFLIYLKKKKNNFPNIFYEKINYLKI